MAHPEIVIRLIGGLGNQLFQLQYGLSLHEKIGGEISVDNSFLAESTKPHEIVAIYALIESYPKVRLVWHELKVIRVIERVCHKVGVKIPGLLGPIFHFENSKVDLHSQRRVIIDGFWQGVSYMNEAFLQKLRSCLQNINNSISNDKVVCVHIRRGDYTASQQIFHGEGSVLSLDYYKRAFTYFKNELGSPYFEIFTDDEPWTKQIFGQMPDVSVVASSALTPFELLARMATYHNYVIANSTLSWWAAVASPVMDKKVILPRVWLKGISSKKYCCEGWLMI